MIRQELSARIEGVFLGRVAERWEGKPPSAIGKTAADGSQDIDELGFLADQQADLTVHGGVDKAIHHYAADHYGKWIAEAEMPAGTVPAAFGENIATVGLTEDTMCIGDTLRLGTAVVQISQGRQPCWKVSAHTGNDKMAYLFQKTGRTGWYYRVLEPGQAAVGDALMLMDRTQPDWTVARVTRARLTLRVSSQDAEVLAEMAELASGWREAFARMAEGDREEDTTARLQGRKPA